MRNIVDELLHGIQVGLGEAETEVKLRIGVVLTMSSPITGDVMTFFMRNERGKYRVGNGQAQKTQRKEWNEVPHRGQ